MAERFANNSEGAGTMPRAMLNKIPGGLLRFHLPEGSNLDMNGASARIMSVLQGLPSVSVRRLIQRGEREIYVDAVFPLRGYRYIRDRFKTERDLGTPLLAVRTATTSGDRLGGLEASKRRRAVYQQR